MHNKILISIVLFCLFSVNLFSQEEIPYVKVNRGTINMLHQLRNTDAEVNTLIFRINKPLSIFFLDNNNSVPDIVISNRMMVSSNENQPDKIEINNLHDGMISRLTNESLVIIFKVDIKNIEIGFRYNFKDDNFIPYTAMYNLKSYILENQTDIPQLMVSSKVNSGINEIYAYRSSNILPVQETRNFLPERTFYEPQRRNFHNDRNTNITRNTNTSRTNYIMGTGSLTSDRIINYIYTQNGNVNRSEALQIINTYIREAQIEGINHDIAIAQMLRATNFLRDNNRMSARNYAGFAPTENWRGSFNSLESGVRAHIHHLKTYAAGNVRGRNESPRAHLIRNQGQVQTLERLYTVWAENSFEYGAAIDAILAGLYRASLSAF